MTTKNKPNPALTTADKLAEAEDALRQAANAYAAALRAVGNDIRAIASQLDEAATVAESDNVISLPNSIKPGPISERMNQAANDARADAAAN